MNLEEFILEFNNLCEWHRRTPNELVEDAYFEALRFLTSDQWIAAIKASYKVHKFMPIPDELLALVAPSGEEKAIEQWTLIHALACRGDVDTTGLDDEAIAALEQMTAAKSPASALRELGRFNDYQTAKWESQFKRLYALAVQRAPLDSLPPAPTQSMLQGAK
jgi:hypothetical protein